MFHLGLIDPAASQEFFVTAEAAGTLVTMSAHVWRKPKGLRFSSWFLIGAGAGGGGGFTKVSGASAGGGGAGGSGAIVRAIFLNEMLPDELYIWVPAGGPGGAGGNPATIGTAGGRVFVGFDPTSIAAASILLCSGAANAGGGGPGLTGAAGAGGAGGTIATNATAMWTSLALSWVAIAGSAGAAGGFDAAGVAKTVDQIVTGGAGGGGGQPNNNGGAITGAGIVPSILGASSVTAPGNGLWQNSPHALWFATGGPGGFASDTATGSKGGDGALGSGAGGGGSGVTGARGGDGGPGYVRVDCW